MLARDNADQLCAVCQSGRRRDRAPQVPTEFWDDGVMVDALASGDFGRVLRAYRQHPFHGRPLSQAIVAGWLHVSQASLSRIELGQCRLTVDDIAGFAGRLGLSVALRYVELYGANAGELGFPAPLPMEAKQMASATLPVEEEPAEENEDVRRRGFLALLGVTALTPLDGKLELVRRGLDLSREPIDLDLDEWERTAYAYCGELRTTPPAQLLVHLLADFDEIAQVLDRARLDGERRRLTHVAGQLAVLIAHSLVSLGEDQAGRRWWRTARAAAHHVGDPALAAFVHGQQAMLSLYGSHAPAQVLDLVDEAEAVAHGTACAGLASALGARAQALAVLGRTKAARTALAGLSTVVERLPEHVTGEQRFFYGWPEYRLRHIESYTFTRLGDLCRASEAQGQALALYAPTEWRGPAQVRLHRAACLVAAGDVVDGVDHAAGVLRTLPDERRRDGFIQPVGRAVLAQLPERALRLPAVQDYRELLADPTGEPPPVR